MQTISHRARVPVCRLLGKRGMRKLVLLLCGCFTYWGNAQGTDILATYRMALQMTPRFLRRTPIAAPLWNQNRSRIRGYCNRSRPMVSSRRSATRARPICLSRRRNRLSHHILRRWKGHPESPSPHDFGPEIIARLRNLPEGWRSMSVHELEHQSRIKEPLHELRSAGKAEVL
jgi:hypothetical protein